MTLGRELKVLRRALPKRLLPIPANKNGVRQGEKPAAPRCS